MLARARSILICQNGPSPQRSYSNGSKNRVIEPAGSPLLVRMHPNVGPDGANIAGGVSILRQDVDFTKLLLKLLDSLDAIRVSFSDMLGRHGRPALIAWYNRNRD